MLFSVSTLEEVYSPANRSFGEFSELEILGSVLSFARYSKESDYTGPWQAAGGAQPAYCRNIRLTIG